MNDFFKSDFAKHFTSWIGLILMCLAGLEWYLLPEMRKVARTESNRVLYLYYSELAESYEAIPDKKPHQIGRLSEVRNKRDLYRSYMAADYKEGISQ